MNNSRFLLILFVLAFLVIQVVSFMTSISRHEERMVKLDRILSQVEQGSFFDLKMDPVVEMKKEKAGFKNETIGFIVKVLVICGAAAIVLTIMKKGRKPREG